MGDYNINTLNEMKESPTLNQEFSNIFSSHYYHKLRETRVVTRENIGDGMNIHLGPSNESNQ